MTDVEDDNLGFHSHCQIQNKEIGFHPDHQLDSLKYLLGTNLDTNPSLVRKVTKRSQERFEKMTGKSNVYKEDDQQNSQEWLIYLLFLLMKVVKGLLKKLELLRFFLGSPSR